MLFFKRQNGTRINVSLCDYDKVESAYHDENRNVVGCWDILFFYPINDTATNFVDEISTTIRYKEIYAIDGLTEGEADNILNAIDYLIESGRKVLDYCELIRYKDGSNEKSFSSSKQ